VSTLCADGNAVRPLAEASLPLPPERRYSDGNAGATTWYDRAVCRPGAADALRGLVLQSALIAAHFPYAPIMFFVTA